MSYEIKDTCDFKTVKYVKEDSIASELGIKEGFEIISINDVKINDVIDYLFLINDEYVEVEFEYKGQRYIYEIEKDYEDDLGVVFNSELLDKPRTCHNNCIFCFMNQLPKDVRDTLIFKDDDYRLAFFSGNYITMTNMSEDDIDRIIRYRLSPLNISIHASNGDIRCKMLNNKNAGKVLKYIDKLNKNDIKMNMQIVLCKGINDGKVLDDTINYLSKYIPNIRCIGIVPVGLTKYRDKLYNLEAFDKNDCIEVIKTISKYQNKFIKKYNETYVYLADEFYIKADISVPNYETYGDFENIENGIGMIADFNYEFDNYINKLQSAGKDIKLKNNICILTGKITENYIKEKVEKLKNIFKSDSNIKVLGIENNFFGKEITVTGLISAGDIIANINDIDKEYTICIPSVCLNDNNMFLDDISLEELTSKYNNITIYNTSAKSFVNNLLI